MHIYFNITVYTFQCVIHYIQGVDGQGLLTSILSLKMVYNTLKHVEGMC